MRRKSMVVGLLICFGTQVTVLGQAGQLDPTFNATVDGPVFALALQGDGRIIVGGEFAAVNGKRRQHLARINADGSLDRTFDAGGTFGAPVARIVLRDGSIYAANVHGVFKLAQDGELQQAYDAHFVFAVDDLGRIISVGQQYSLYLYRLNPDGVFDSSFGRLGVGCCFDNRVNELIFDANNRLLLAGDFFEVDDWPALYVARLSPDGVVDPTFSSASVNDVVALDLLPDGRIVAIGQQGVTRLLPSGSTDVSFQTRYSGHSDFMFGGSAQRNGKVIVFGDFTQQHSFGSDFIVRFNADGSTDTNFAAMNLSDNFIEATVIQPDGKILIGGSFTLIHGTARNSIARLFGDAPELDVQSATGGKTILSWPTTNPNWILQVARNRNSSDWSTVTESVVTVGSISYVTNRVADGKMFRLVHP